MDDEPNPSPARFSPPWGALALAAIVLIGTTAMALPGRLVDGEADIFAWGNGLPRGVGLPLEGVMHLGSFVAAFVLAGVGFALGRRRVAAGAVVAWVLVRVASTIIKAAVDRPRPPGFFADAMVRQHLPADNGFPSSHAANAMALAIVVATTWPRLRPVVAVGALLVGVARLYVGVHLPLDLVGGWALGILCGTAATAAVSRALPGR